MCIHAPARPPTCTPAVLTSVHLCASTFLCAYRAACSTRIAPAYSRGSLHALRHMPMHARTQIPGMASKGTVHLALQWCPRCACASAHAHLCIRLQKHAVTHICTQARTHAGMHIHARARTHARTHAHSRTHAHAHAHARTHARMCSVEEAELRRMLLDYFIARDAAAGEAYARTHARTRRHAGT